MNAPRWISLLLAVALLICSSGCGADEEEPHENFPQRKVALTIEAVALHLREAAESGRPEALGDMLPDVDILMKNLKLARMMSSSVKLPFEFDYIEISSDLSGEFDKGEVATIVAEMQLNIANFIRHLIDRTQKIGFSWREARLSEVIFTSPMSEPKPIERERKISEGLIHLAYVDGDKRIVVDVTAFAFNRIGSLIYIRDYSPKETEKLRR